MQRDKPVNPKEVGERSPEYEITELTSLKQDEGELGKGEGKLFPKSRLAHSKRLKGENVQHSVTWR